MSVKYDCSRFDLILNFSFSEGPKKLGALEVAAIVIGCIVGTVILCCLLGTIIDCFMHVYKYWCSCLHKAYHCSPSEMVALRTPNGGPNEPTVLVVRAIPPSYSTIIVSCEAASRLAARSRENPGSNHVTLVSADDLNSTPTQEMSMQTITTTHSLSFQSPPQSPEHQILIKLADNNNKKEISTQTPSPFFSRSAGTCTRPEPVRLGSDPLTIGDPLTSITDPLSDGQHQPSAPLAQSPSSSSISSTSPMLEGATLPPSYSSIFRNDYITYATDTRLQTTGGFLAPPR